MHRLILLSVLMISLSASAQTIQQMNFEQLQKKISGIKDQVIVMNFWATWCKPCVEELPRFEELNRKYGQKQVKVILVNLDFNSKIKTDVGSFVKKKDLKSEIWHITDTDPNTWINKIDPSWSGAIPATVIYGKDHHKIKFVEGQMTLEQLEGAVSENIIPPQGNNDSNH